MKRDMSDMHEMKENKIILYGAGCCGAMFAELLQKADITVECFFDKNPHKTGMKIMGIPVQQPVPGKADRLVVVCILKKGTLFEEIAIELRKMGYEKILHIYDLRKQGWLFAGQSLILVPDREQVLSNLERYSNLERHLADDISREVLQRVLQFLMEDADVEFPAKNIEEQYFAYDIYQQIENESVVDCGAFKGEVMGFFLEKNHNQFAHYLAIEPDEAYLPSLKKRAKGYEPGKIEIKNCALSAKQEILRLRNYANEDSVIKEDGEKEIQAYSLDELMEDSTCTFLKIDVEGYDKKTIQGAEKLIQEQKPVVAVAAYHHESDFYEIFELLHNMYEGYQFYLRSYMNIQETILYAIPPWRLLKEDRK